MDDNEKTELEALRAMRDRLDAMILAYGAEMGSWHWSARPQDRTRLEQTHDALRLARNGDDL